MIKNDPTEHLDDSYPNLRNIAKWEKLWDQSTWILALEGVRGAPEDQMNLKSRLVHSLMEQLPLKPGTEAFLKMTAHIENHLHLAVSAFQKPERILTEEKLSAFGFVTIQEPELFWNYVQKNSSLQGLNPLATLEDRISFQWRTMAGVQGVRWVEPSLENELFAAAPYEAPAEIKRKVEMASILQRIKAVEAYKFVAESGLKENPIVIAVLDTGVDYEHPDLKDQMYPNPDEVRNGIDDDGNGYIDDIFGINATLNPGEIDIKGEPVPGAADVGGAGKKCPDEVENDPLTSKCGHGTHVAGIIAAKHGADLETLGVCPSCKIVSLRVAKRCARRGENGSYFVNCGIDDAAQVRALAYILNLKKLYIHILNMSLGKYLRSRAMAFYIRNLQKNGLLVVAAAGNHNTDSQNYPAAYGSVLSVCATSTPEGRGIYGKADFSNFGDWVDICAPGTNIISTFPGGNTRAQSGTSQATPVVAGAAGYLLSVDPRQTAETVIETLKLFSNATGLYEDEKLNYRYRGEYPDGSKYFMLGSGFLDLENAIRKQAKSGVSEGYLQPQVKGGCIVSSIGKSSANSVWEFLGSVPFCLGVLWSILRLRHRFCA